MLFLPHSTAHQAHPRPAPAAVQSLLESLEGIPEALTDHHPERLAAAKARAVKQWSRCQDELAGRFAPERYAEIALLMKNLETAGGTAAANLALDASDRLAVLLPSVRTGRLAAADRACMRAWLRIDAGEWDQLPDLGGAFAPLLAETRTAQRKTREATHAALARLSGDRERRDGAAAKREVEKLLELVDQFEK